MNLGNLSQIILSNMGLLMQIRELLIGHSRF